MAVLVTFMPESPYQLLSEGKSEAAASSLQWLRGKEYDIKEDLEELRQAVEAKQAVRRIHPGDLLTRRVYLIPFALMLAIHFVQQFSGINAVVFYLADIFLKAGFDVDNSLAYSAYVSLTQMAATGASIFLVERTGRRLLLMVSSAGMSVSILALGLYFYFDENKERVCDPGTTTTEATTGLNGPTYAFECRTKDGFSLVRVSPDIK